MKPLQLISSNGLQCTPEETVYIIRILMNVAFDKPTEQDRQLARSLLLKSAMAYPDYANLKK